MDRLVNDLPLLSVCTPLLASLCLKSPLAAWMMTICGTYTNSRELLWETSLGSHHFQPAPDLGPTHSGAKQSTESAIDTALSPTALSLVAMQGWYKRRPRAMSRLLFKVKGHNWWWPHLCSRLCQQKSITVKDFMQIIYCTSISPTCTSSCRSHQQGRTVPCFYFSSLPFWQPSLSSSACGSPEFSSVSVFVSVLLFPQLLNSPAYGQMLNQFLNVYTFNTEGHLTLLTSQTTSDLELNALSQSIIRPKYKQKCFPPLFLKLDNCQTKQVQKKN